jgi:hypothetical protein
VTRLSRLFRRAFRRYNVDVSGAALLEMSIIIPVGISLMSGILDFGLAYSARSAGEKALRDATRYLTFLPPNDVCSSWALTNAKNIVRYGKIAPGNADPLIVKGITAADITLVSPASGGCPVGLAGIIELQTNIRYDPIILPAAVMARPTVMSVRHQERWIGQ